MLADRLVAVGCLVVLGQSGGGGGCGSGGVVAQS